MATNKARLAIQFSPVDKTPPLKVNAFFEGMTLNKSPPEKLTKGFSILKVHHALLSLTICLYVASMFSHRGSKNPFSYCSLC